MRFIDLTDKTFGELTVIRRIANGNSNDVRWLCQCSCGNQTEVSSVNLKNGHVRSCGCLKKNHPNHKKHGNSNHWLYRTWSNMKTRCYNHNSKDYKNYGGRGIAVCPEWKDAFKAFYEYVSKLPHFGEDGYTLDRIDNDGNYEPNNVRWATAKKQANNRRKAVVS